ncbi:MAG: hypothetical protein VW338_00110 [Rhodospirillaceae bacterium]
MIVVGIDPGLSGAIFWIGGPNGMMFADMPTVQIDRNGKNKRSVDVGALADMLRHNIPDHVFLEQVGAMPGQGVTSMFAFGQGFGIILGVIGTLGIPMTRVSPMKWKRAMGVPPGKDGARGRASELLPAAAARWPLKKHDGRAEAALIAEYGRRLLNGAG